MSNATERTGPLKGLLVLDFTMIISGPVSTQLLHDNGARVIKVERTGVGDSIRPLGPMVDGKVGTIVAGLNGGKESLEANFKDSDDVAFLKRIIKKADIVVENFRPGVMAKSGLDYDSVKDLNPALIYASISGYGQAGPMHKAPAYDEIIQGASGLMSVTGEPGGPSLIAGCSVADAVTGILTYAAIMTACFAREKTGQGCHIDMSMLESLTMLLVEPVTSYAATGEIPTKHGNDHVSATPFSSYATGGREIVICIGGLGLWKELCAALDKEEWLERPEYAFPNAIHENKDKFRQELEAILKTQDHNYWIEKLGAAGIPVSLVNNVEEAEKIEQHKFRKFFVETMGRHYSGNPLLLSNYPRITERPDVPALGAHNEQIRKEFAV